MACRSTTFDNISVKYYDWPWDTALYQWLNMANWEELFVVIDALSGKVVEVRGLE